MIFRSDLPDGAPAFADNHGIVQMLQGFHRKGVSTVPAAMILIAAVCAASAGKPHSMRSLTMAVRIPYSSVSRITFQLCELGLLSLEQKKGDRRVKFVRANLKMFGRLLPPMAA